MKSIFSPDDNNPLTKEPYSNDYKELFEKLSDLPMYNPETQDKFLKLLKENQLVFLVSSTGSGKSITVPRLALHYTGYTGNVIITQPRQLATLTSSFVSKTLDVPTNVDDKRKDKIVVGYQYRGAKNVTQDTKISFVTDGLLLMQAFGKQLDKYDIIILDEIHERSVQIDLLLYFIKEQLLKKGNKTKIVLMSATVDADQFINYFKGIKAGVLEVQGVSFPITSKFLKKKIKDNELAKAIRKTLRMIVKTSESGDVLVFLHSKNEIHNVINQIRKCPFTKEHKLALLPLYSEMSKEKQDYATHQDKYKELGSYQRKVVFSTNVAESSLTIKGLVYVIDSGLEINKIYNPATYGYKIVKDIVSQANIKQRAGRAGRVQPGKTYHLYTKEKYKSLNQHIVPTIRNDNITNQILLLFNIYKVSDTVTKILRNLIEPPIPEKIKSSYTILHDKNALKKVKDSLEITPLGEALSRFSVEIPVAVMLIYGVKYKCQKEMLFLAALLSKSTQISYWFIIDPDTKELPKVWQKFKHEYGDHLTLLQLFLTFYFKVQKDDKIKWCEENKISYKKFKDIHFIYRQFESRLTQINVDNLDLKLISGDIKNNESKKSDDTYSITGWLASNILKCIHHGIYNNIIINKNNKLFLYGKKLIPIKLGDSVFNKSKERLLLYTELVEMTNLQANVIARGVKEWIKHLIT